MDLLNSTSSNFITNITTPGHPPDPSSLSWDPKAVAPAVVLLLCFLVGVPGNLAVIILKPNWENMSGLTQTLVINLALSDLLCLNTLPFWIYDALFSWSLGTVGCKIVGFLTYCSIYSSILTVTAMSVQRYMQIIHQQKCLQCKKTVLGLLWLSSISFSVPALVFRQDTTQQQDANCDQIYSSTVQEVAVLLTECFVGFSSLILTIYVYVFLNRKLNRATLFNNASTSRLLTSIIVTCFTLWTPYLIFNLVSVGGILDKNQVIINFYNFGLDLFASITFINSCINPLLYAFALGICRKNSTATSNSRELTSFTEA